MLGRVVSRETLERLDEYTGELLRWSPAINLIARATHREAWSRHVLDSLQLVPLVSDPFRSWADLGSGGGLPGIVVACIGAEFFPEVPITLIESDARKAAFLTMMSEKLDLNTRVIRARIEKAPPSDAEIVSARALAPLTELLGFCHRHLVENGTALLPKGRNRAVELEVARQSWHFDLETRKSRIDAEGAIVIIRNLRPLDETR